MNKNFVKIPRSNREYLGYINKNTDHIYMVSEFIDNSIQSAIDNKLGHVEVKIIVDMKQKCIYIIDNAGGIKYENRALAIKNGNDEVEIGNNLNMFGVGMKMAAIWFGRKMTYYTKAIGDDFTYSLTLDVDKLEEDEWNAVELKNIDISNESKINFPYQHGTIIKIENLHLDPVHESRY